MDKRSPLQANTILQFKDKDGNTFLYTIENEYSRGGTCIVYNALYEDNHGMNHRVIIKEFYPMGISIRRDDTGNLIPLTEELEIFEKCKEQFHKAFDVNVQLKGTSGLINIIQNSRDIYEHNDTLYVVADISEGSLFSVDTNRTLEDSIKIIISISKYIQRIHDKGYLYLDLKPENIYVLQESLSIIQLFDFGSMVKQNCIYSQKHLSWSEGFSAPEIKNGKINTIGKTADIYSLGALFFYILFGCAPSALDRRKHAARNFKNSVYDFNKYNPELEKKVSIFLDKTLSSYDKERYSNVGQVIEALDDIYKVSLQENFFINRPVSTFCKNFIGRTRELEDLEDWYNSDDCNFIFVNGEMGCGKTTLVQEFAKKLQKQGVIPVFLTFSLSIEETISDDNNLSINRVSRNYNESTKDYYNRKVSILREIARDEKILLIIDRIKFSPEIVNVNIADCKIIFITSDYVPEHLPVIELGCLSIGEIRDVAKSKLNYEVKIEEEKLLISLIEKFNCNITLVDLLICAINSGFLSIEDAYSRLGNNRLIDLSSDTLDYYKDNKLICGSIEAVLKELAPVDLAIEQEKLVLKVLAMFGTEGIYATDLKEFMHLDNMDVINSLKKLGYIHNEQMRIIVPQLILVVIDSWDWTHEELGVARDIIEKISAEAYVEATLADYPLFVYEKVKRMRKNILILEEFINSPSYKKIPFNWVKNRIKNTYNLLNTPKDVYQKVFMYRRDRIDDGELPDLHKILKNNRYLLSISRNNDFSILSEEFNEWFLYSFIKTTPISDESTIIDYGTKYCKLHSDKNPYHIYCVIDKMAHIYECHGNYKKAEELLDSYKKIIDSPIIDDVAIVWYYQLLLEFYDNQLDGYYDLNKPHKKFVKYLEVVEEAISYIENANHKEFYPNLAEFYCAKANVLIRGGASESQVSEILSKAKSFVESNTLQFSTARKAYYLAEAWYHVYYDNDKEALIKCVVWAQYIAEHTELSKLDLIDYTFIPAANMFYELGNVTNNSYAGFSIYFLDKGIELCDENIKIDAYKRKKQELLEYKDEVLRGLV